MKDFFELIKGKQILGVLQKFSLGTKRDFHTDFPQYI